MQSLFSRTNFKLAISLFFGFVVVLAVYQMTSIPAPITHRFYYLKDTFFGTEIYNEVNTSKPSGGALLSSALSNLLTTTLPNITLLPHATAQSTKSSDNNETIPNGVIYQARQYPETEFTNLEKLRNSSESIKGSAKLTILLWTKLFHRADWALGELGDAPFKKLGCPVSNCLLTTDRNLLSSASAVLVNFRDDFDFSDRPKQRQLSQHWIFFIWESPEHTYHWTWQGNQGSHRYLLDFAGFFNWTMTYRLDSDIPFLYGRFSPRPSPTPGLKKNYLEGKTKSVVWMQRNCDTRSRRTQFVQELQRHIDVDIIGGCGVSNSDLTNGICNRPDVFRPMTDECIKHISTTYKFYIAAENSLCRDYVTEKFYRGASLNVVTVVLNGAEMSQFGPPMSYIEANKFETPEKLANFLKKVGNDPDLYNSYFNWKNHYQAENFWDNDAFTRMFCDLCAKVTFAHLEPKKYAKVYENIDDWWTGQGKCYEGKSTF